MPPTLKPHKKNELLIRIYYEDTDFSGVVYHASYLRFMERGRTELLRDLGIHHHELLDAKDGPYAFAVRKMTLDFLKSARIDDQLVITTQITHVRGASVILRQHITRENAASDILVSAEVKVAFISTTGGAIRLPADMRAKLQ